MAEANRSAEAAYSRPPVLVGAHGEGNGRVSLDGFAQPGSRIRLASPRGDASLADVDSRGAWRLTVAAPGAPQLFGLSMIERGRTVQSEGYVLVTPDGTAAQLRAGAGAVVLAARDGSAAILAVDFDSKGGAVVSGRAAPRSALEVWVDGARLARGAASPDGRFSAPLDQPLTFSDHRLDIRDGAGRADAVVRLAPPAPLLRGPYRASAAPGGWRIDWMTPGGGLQTTLLLASDSSRSPAPSPAPSPNRGAP